MTTKRLLLSVLDVLLTILMIPVYLLCPQLLLEKGRRL